MRVHVAEAVRTEQPHAALARDAHDLRLAARSFLAHLGELRRDQDARADAGLRALTDRLQGEVRGHGHNRHVDRLRARLDRRYGR